MSTTAPYEYRRAARDTSDRVVGGVASGLARHLALPVLWIRVAFLVSSMLGGVGLLAYAGLWMVLPTDARFDASAPGLAGATRDGRRPGVAQRIGDLGPVLALSALALGVLLTAQIAFGAGAALWPVLLGVGGVALLWRQADEAQRERWLDSGGLDPIRTVFGRGGWASYARVAAGVAMVVGAVTLFSLRSGDLGIAGDVALAALLGTLGLGIVVGPWIFRLASDLTSERAERVRSQERADLAAHLHDSVLQTLALIQKNAHQPATVAQLARAQERDLRSWLYDDPAPADSTVAAALKAVGAEVDDAHHVAVDVVTVGDTALTDRLRPLVLATREALVNAAKHAGVGRVDVYAEVGSSVDVFVRDRGAGFDLAQVAADRQGVRGSIIDRMERHGGSARVLSTPGEGTEVRLSMPVEEESG